MHATPAELVELRRLMEATHTGHVTVDNARAAVAELRRIQQVRNGWPPKPNEHDADDCSDMICTEPVCIARNVSTAPQGAGHANPFRKAS